MPTFSDEIESRLVEVRQRIRNDVANVTEIFHLVVIQSAGRSFALGLGNNAIDEHATALVLTPSDLAVIARFEAGDQLALWKFARAAAALRNSTYVLAWSTLDEYGLYRKSRHSYYVSDDARPNLITVATDFGAELRLEDSEGFDVHGVSLPDHSGILDMQRRWTGSRTPIYSADPIRVARLTFLVEFEALRIWILQGVENIEESIGQRLYLMFCDAIAYWLWQVAPSIPRLIDRSYNSPMDLAFHVVLEEPEVWHLGLLDRQHEDWLSIRELEHGGIELRLRPSAKLVLTGPDNSGERELLRAVLTFIADITANLSGADTSLRVNEMIEAHAPLGQKKQLLFLDAASDLRLLPGNLPSTRLVKEADVEALLDMAGSSVSKALSLEVGIVSPGVRVKVFNTVVGLYFAELQLIIAGLQPMELLDRLIALHESIVHESAHQRLTLPTQLACFGADAAYVSTIQGRIDELTKADAAARFLVEYIVAQPPRGDQLLSLSTVDRLMALAAEIIDKGTLSDALQYDLADIEISILPSGRLGIDRSGKYIVGMDSGREEYARREVQSAHRYFADHWKRNLSRERPPTIGNLDTVTAAEFGFSMTEIANCLTSLRDIGLDLHNEPKVLPLDDLRERLAESLGWSRPRVEAILDLFVLRQRVEYLPRGAQTEVYPWRYNRQLSYLRRPLIVRMDGEVETVLWGVRHLARVGPTLLRLIMSGRLKARSPEMRSHIGRMRNAEAEAFNDRVADVFAERTDLIVRKRVKKVANLRIEWESGYPLGDIDVLVVNPSRHQIVAVEVKDFDPARTPFELSREMSGLFAVRDSALSHHTQRVEWLKKHVDAVLDWLALPRSRDKWKVVGLIVVSRDLLSRYIHTSPIEIVTFEALQESNGKRWI